MLEIGSKILVLLLVFVVGFFVGKRHGQRVERAASTIKDAAGKL